MATILLIDDSLIQLGIRRRVLDKPGSLCSPPGTHPQPSRYSAPTRAAALPDAIITDHIMPEVCGSEFVRQLRQANPDVPVIVISGLPEAVE